jgi:hypothetical protein
MAGERKDRNVSAFKFGLVHAPLTPFADGRIDYDTYGKVIDFHLRNGAEGLALPMPSRPLLRMRTRWNIISACMRAKVTGHGRWPRTRVEAN